MAYSSQNTGQGGPPRYDFQFIKSENTPAGVRFETCSGSPDCVAYLVTDVDGRVDQGVHYLMSRALYCSNCAIAHDSRLVETEMVAKARFLFLVAKVCSGCYRWQGC